MGLKQSYGKIKPFIQYLQTGEKVVANTLVETSFFNGEHTGTKKIPDTYLDEFSQVQIRIFGTLSTVGTPQTTLRIYWNDLKLVESVGTLPNNMSNNYYDVFMDIVMGTGKTYLNLNGRTIFQTSSGVASSALRGFYNNQKAFTLADLYDFNITYQWGTANAGNILKVQNIIIDIK
jgi:hypothetical protein